MHQIQMKEVFRKPFFILFAVGSLLSLIVSQVCIFLAIEYRVSTYASMYAIFLLCKYWVYICIALTIFAYLCLADSHTRDIDETIAAYKGGKYYQRFCVKYFIAGAVVLQLLMLALYWFAFRTMEHFADLFPALFTMYICNIFLPFLVCLLAASFFACWNNQIRGVTGLIIFLILVSPLSEVLVNGDKPNSIVERILHAVRHIFGFFMRILLGKRILKLDCRPNGRDLPRSFSGFFCFSDCCSGIPIKRREQYPSYRWQSVLCC